ncbi:MAG TPA: DUF4142 domain-containing protein [Verrucomicrobiae bacterium]|nr:DUF4142 domain-containing protein [Verrucomicrobiae bacterium]
MRATTIITFATGTMLLCAAPLVHAQATPGARDQASAMAQRGQLSDSDYRFVEKAARGGLEEVELGQLAEQKGNDQSVREFGKRMVTDHTKLNDQLKQIASQKGATLPASMTQHENSSMQKLEGATGVKFDQTYAKNMVKDHKKDLKEFQNAAKSLQDPELRNFAESAVPILQEHLTMAQNMETTVKSEK